MDTSSSAPVVLVTGASSGIGRAIARLLAENGYHVFGTSRQPQTDTLDNFTLLTLDITNDDSARACIDTVIERVGRLDILINNAGVELVGALEETTLEEARWVFETNFFGAVRMTQIALGHMRPRREGQIVFISSGLGRASFPFDGFYCASKHALEGYIEALCYELNIFGIRVSSVLPGYYRSEIAIRQRVVSEPLPDYDSARTRYLALTNAWARNAPDPLPVARLVLRILRTTRPALRYPVGIEAQLAPPLAHFFPLAVRFKAGRWMLGIDDPRDDAQRWGGQIALFSGAAWLGAHMIKWLGGRGRTRK